MGQQIFGQRFIRHILSSYVITFALFHSASPFSESSKSSDKTSLQSCGLRSTPLRIWNIRSHDSSFYTRPSTLGAHLYSFSSASFSDDYTASDKNRPSDGPHLLIVAPMEFLLAARIPFATSILEKVAFLTLDLVMTILLFVYYECSYRRCLDKIHFPSLVICT